MLNSKLLVVEKHRQNFLIKYIYSIYYITLLFILSLSALHYIIIYIIFICFIDSMKMKQYFGLPLGYLLAWDD